MNRAEPIDIVMLTHDRLDHLERAVDALEARTPEPYRLTIVDNASGPATYETGSPRTAHRFAQLILRDTNEHVPALRHGIAATTSDPFVVTDPDVVVPDLEPSWLARMLDLLERHPDFGLIALGLDPSNRPPPHVLEPEHIEPGTLVDDEIVEAHVGTIFQFIRRDALVVPYRSDGHACTAVQRAGYRRGWSPHIRGLHLGWDDFRLLPGSSARQARRARTRATRSPTPRSTSSSGPRRWRRSPLRLPCWPRPAGTGSRSAIVELAWDGPVVGAVAPAAVSVEAEGLEQIPLDDGSAAVVVLTHPPDEKLLDQACRVATRLIIALAPLETFSGRTAHELAPEGWEGREAPAVGDLQLALVRNAQAERSVAAHGDRWLEMLGAATFGESALRLWIWERADPADTPDHVQYDSARVQRWRPGTLARPAPRAHGRLMRFWVRADLADRSEVWRGRWRRWFRRRSARATYTAPLIPAHVGLPQWTGTGVRSLAS